MRRLAIHEVNQVSGAMSDEEVIMVGSVFVGALAGLAIREGLQLQRYLPSPGEAFFLNENGRYTAPSSLASAALVAGTVFIVGEISEAF